MKIQFIALAILLATPVLGRAETTVSCSFNSPTGEVLVNGECNPNGGIFYEKDFSIVMGTTEDNTFYAWVSAPLDGEYPSAIVASLEVDLDPQGTELTVESWHKKYTGYTLTCIGNDPEWLEYFRDGSGE